jgi:hypothetical protein
LSTLKELNNGQAPYVRSFGYDTHGNLTQKDNVAVAFGNAFKPHLPTQVGTNIYTPDANGNLASRFGPEVPAGVKLRQALLMV